MQPLVSVPSSPQLSSSTAAEAAAGLSEDSAAAERFSGIEMEAAVASSCTSSLLLHTAGDLRKKEPGRNNFLNIWWPMPLCSFLFYVTDWVLIRVHFTYSNFAWWCGRGVVWRLGLFWSCIDVIVVRIKVSRGILPFSPNGDRQCGH